MDDKILEIKALSSVYITEEETVHAVNNISFSLRKGETLGLVGETGAGKTTTALNIMRLLPERTGKVTSGEIIFEGKNLLKLTEKEMQSVRGEKIAMIFQDPMTSLNPVITIGEQIGEALMLHGNLTPGETKKRVSEILELVGIPAERSKEYPHQFSGGMKQRVIIAIALSCNPDLLIADEPTTALDVTIQAQVMNLISELKEKFNMAMVMITHDLGIVAQICDKVAVMYAGEIVEYGSLEEIYSGERHHPYTKGLFECIPSLITDTPRLKTIDGLMPDPTNLPKGCKFSPRCRQCMDICKREEPEYFVNGSHRIKCHLFTQEGLDL